MNTNHKVIAKLEDWGRKSQHEFFKEHFLFPHAGLTALMDVQNVVELCQKNKWGPFHVMGYLISKSINQVQEFRLRFLDDQVVEYEVVHPSFTVLNQQNNFVFCQVDFSDDFKTYYEHSVERISRAKSQTQFESASDRAKNNLVYMSCLPLVHFTQVTHPVHHDFNDVTPRVVWGKYQQEKSELKMPLSVQAHHSFVDGYHASLVFEAFQKNCLEFCG